MRLGAFGGRASVRRRGANRDIGGGRDRRAGPDHGGCPRPGRRPLRDRGPGEARTGGLRGGAGGLRVLAVEFRARVRPRGLGRRARVWNWRRACASGTFRGVWASMPGSALWPCIRLRTPRSRAPTSPSRSCRRRTGPDGRRRWRGDRERATLVSTCWAASRPGPFRRQDCRTRDAAGSRRAGSATVSGYGGASRRRSWNSMPGIPDAAARDSACATSSATVRGDSSSSGASNRAVLRMAEAGSSWKPSVGSNIQAVDSCRQRASGCPVLDLTPLFR